MPRRRRLLDDSDGVPSDDLRCRRTDGRGWRCSRRAMDGITFCQHHFLQARRNLEKHKGRDPGPPAGAPHEPPSRKRTRKGEVPTEEMITAALKRKKERKGGRGKSRDAEARMTRVLPNGLMTIASAPAGGLSSEGSPLDRKLGFDEGRLLTRRCIRSKNAEPIPVGPLKKLPCGRGLGKGRKRICHRCGEKKLARMVRCLSCRKRFFCTRCLKKWSYSNPFRYTRGIRCKYPSLPQCVGSNCSIYRYSEWSEVEVKIACPVCRGCCDCKTCSYIGDEDGDFKELASGQNEVKKTKHGYNSQMCEVEVKMACPVCRGHCNCVGTEDGGCKEVANGLNKFKKTQHAYNLISQLLPLLKQIYQKQLNELEIEESNQGRGFSGIQLQVDQPCNEHANCNYCRISLVDFHRSCSKCSYRLCLSCFRKILKGSFSQTVATDAFKYESKKAHKRVIKEFNGMKRILSTGTRPDNPSLSIDLLSDNKENSESSISCPPKEFGGCGDGLLKLMFTIPFGWSKDLGKTAEEVAFSNDSSLSLHLYPHCSSPGPKNQKIGQFSISLQEASGRDKSF